MGKTLVDSLVILRELFDEKIARATVNADVVTSLHERAIHFPLIPGTQLKKTEQNSQILKRSMFALLTELFDVISLA